MMDKNNNLIPDPKVLFSKIKKNRASEELATDEANSIADNTFFSTESMEQAAAEAESLQEKHLDREARVNDHKRTERSKKVFFFMDLTMITVLFFGTVVGVSCMFYHWLSPVSLHFLTAAQVDNLENIAYGIFGTNFFKGLYKKIS